MGNPNYNRPILLSIIAILSILMGLIILLGGSVLIISGASTELGQTVSENLAEDGVALEGLSLAVAGGIMAFGGLIIILVGAALFTGKGWAWWLTVIVYSISLAFSVLVAIAGGGLFVLEALWAVFVLFYMTRPNTKGWFNI